MTDLYTNIIGQDRAVAQLQAAARHNVHAYLFVGPAGVGKRLAAQAFAASLLCPTGGCGTCDICVRVVNEKHPDFVVVARRGASISLEQARDIVQIASRAPMEGGRQVILLTDFHLVDEAAPALLKTIEEPNQSTVFIVSAEQVPNELLTIASRCVRVEFSPLLAEDIERELVAEGFDPAIAAECANAANGSLPRARLLAHDPHVSERRELWKSIPSKLDGTGATISDLVEQIEESLNEVVEPLKEQQTAELKAFTEQAKEIGEKVTARKEVEDRHKREQRRLRTDELRFGLLTLSIHYRDLLLTDEASREFSFAALDAIRAADEALIRNPNESLLLSALLLALEPRVSV